MQSWSNILLFSVLNSLIATLCVLTLFELIMLFRVRDNIAVARQADVTVTDPVSILMLQSALQKLTRKAAQSSMATNVQRTQTFPSCDDLNLYD